MQITLQKDGQQVGPYSVEQVRAGLADGTFQLSDLAWFPGAAAWGPLADVPGIGWGAFPAYIQSSQNGRTCNLAIWSLVLGILSLLCVGLPGIPGVICGHLAMGRIKRSGGKETGSGLAIAGLVTGYIRIFIVGVAFLAGITAPLVIRQRKIAYRTEAMGNARSMGLALFEFGTEYGAFPNEATVAKVAAASETPIVTGNSSNSRFRQLIRAGISQSEIIFYAHAQGAHKPDNIYTESRALEKGECGFAYVENLDPKGKSRCPIAMTPFVPGTNRFDPTPFDGKAVVLWTDNSVTAERIDRATGQVILKNGESLLDPANSIWSGKPPVILLPE